MAKDFFKSAREGIIKGFFWSIGVSLGFVFTSLVIVTILSRLVTFPVIGDFVAQVVEATQNSLQTR